MAKRDVVISGGYVTSEKRLEPVADALNDMGLINGLSIFGLLHARRNPHELAQAAGGSLFLSHSAGVMALNTEAFVPDEIVAANPPEPCNIPGLVGGAVRKSVKQLGYAFDRSNPLAGAYARIERDHLAQTALHTWKYLRLIPDISRFSTAPVLARAADPEGVGVPSTVLVSAEDEFFTYPPVERFGDAQVLVHDGNHDALLADPASVLKVWAEATSQ